MTLKQRLRLAVKGVISDYPYQLMELRRQAVLAESAGYAADNKQKALVLKDVLKAETNALLLSNGMNFIDNWVDQLTNITEGINGKRN